MTDARVFGRTGDDVRAGGAFGTGSTAGIYELWASRLRAWARDPATSLNGLPTLDDDTFDQSTYLRLMGHLNEALALFMDSWNEQLTKSISTAHSKHELGTQMVRLRQLLEPRVRLVELPEWPTQIREALRTALRTDLESIQQQLEEAVSASGDGGRFDRGAQDGLVAVLRENSLTALLRKEPRLTGGTPPPVGASPGDGAPPMTEEPGQHDPALTSARSIRARRLIL